MIFKIIQAIFLCLLSNITLTSQNNHFTLKDSLRGSMRKEREYDVTHYELHVKINLDKKFLEGYNIISYVGLTDSKEIQVDLFDNMSIKFIKSGKKNLKYRRIFNAIFIDHPIQNGKSDKIVIEYEGNPVIAKNAPWDGGFVFKKR